MPFRRFPDPPVPPVPVSAAFTTELVVVTFDQQLVAGQIDSANWSVRHDGFVYSIGNAVADGASVLLTLTFAVEDPGTDGVSYAADPADVIGENGKPAQAFSSFPFE